MSGGVAGLAVEVRGLAKRFGEVQAVRGVDLSIETGTVFALLGPNGAGKTTTVEILEGFTARDEGRVTVLGLDPSVNRRALLERVGIVLQELAVEQFLTVRETLQRRASYYPSPRDIGSVLSTIGLEQKADARVRTLSGGQQRRLDLGLGLVGDPELLFLDEPTTGFDPNARREAWEVIKRLASEGRTVLLTTHYMDEAQELADRVAVISKGAIVAEGTPQTIGGRGDQKARVRFLLPPGTDGTADLPSEPESGWRLVQTPDGKMVETESAAPTKLLHELTGHALRQGIELQRLEVIRPSLEDVYLRITAEDQ